MARKENKDKGLRECPGRGWLAIWTLPNGKVKQKLCLNKSEARRYHNARRSEVERVKAGMAPLSLIYGEAPKEPAAADVALEPDEMTLAQALEHYRPELERKKSYKRDMVFLERWKRRLGHKKLSEITRRDGFEAQEELKATLIVCGDCKKRVKAGGALKAICQHCRFPSPKSINLETDFLRMILNRADDDDLLAVKGRKNPMSRLRRLEVEEKMLVQLESAQDERLKSVMEPDHFELIAFAVDTGLRRGEQFGLRWENIDFTKRHVFIRTSKKGKPRYIPFTNRVLALLLRRLAVRGKSSWVFPNHDGTRPMCAENFVKRVFKPALETAGIVGLRWHDLRHSFASRLASGSVNLYHVQTLMGHKTAAMTQHYAHLPPETLQAAIATLN